MAVAVAHAAMAQDCQHAPPGATLVSNQWWADGVPPVRFGQDRAGWHVEGGRARLALSQDSAEGNVMVGTFPAGMSGGIAPFRLDLIFPAPSRGIYWCVRHWIDSAWTDNGNSGTKFGFLLDAQPDAPTSTNHYANLSPRIGINLQSRGGILNRNMFAAWSLYAHRGEWHTWEFLVAADTGAAGVAQIWVDGAPVMAKTDVRYFPAGHLGAWRGLTWNPTYGGGLNPVPYTMRQRIAWWRTWTFAPTGQVAPSPAPAPAPAPAPGTAPAPAPAPEPGPREPAPCVCPTKPPAEPVPAPAPRPAPVEEPGPAPPPAGEAPRTEKAAPPAATPCEASRSGR
jgi:hypothetical protein